VWVALISVSILVAGCTTAHDRAGGSGPPQVLVLASNDHVGLPPAMARFVDRVAEDSGGRLTIRVASGWRGGDNEPRVIRDVASGRADLGWSGTRAFDVVGVSAFQPLHAPFLVNSYAAEAAVVRAPVAAEMLGSLAPLGLDGLALLADGLRLPAGVAEPLLTPGDFTGISFGTIDSRIQSAGIAALGARPASATILNPPDTHGLDGVETMWGTYLGNAVYSMMPFITGNAVLWPRTVAILGNSAKLGALDAAAREWLAQAAADAATWSTEHAADRDADQIATVCRFGARIAEATPQQLAALRSAAEPVYAQLRADPPLAATLTAIETLVKATAGDVPAAVPADCVYHPGDEERAAPPLATLTSPGRAGDLPPGSYRVAFAVDELIADGMDARTARTNAGTWTWTVAGGRWRFDIKLATTGLTGPGVYASCEGWYDVHGDGASFTTTTRESDGGECAPPTWSARWSAGNPRLAWSAVSVADFRFLFAGKPWQRIG
jgi:TRAP-type C4-dicarboxylate transport system substrate-binding protein